MDKIRKFLRNIDAKLRERLRRAIQAIMANELEGLDIAPLQGQKNVFRCRVRNVRIIFMRTGTGNVLCGIGFRGGVYRHR
ncbi:MAG: hypothetical protein PHX93_04055 [Candidatus Peribacteraceae bacterium]|jgi:mRNA-degrading endonuclease RelE of RelBE toxin-antitoxin system|nr:hypothetical protein [Candidatus Peribacteraceae bacterium]